MDKSLVLESANIPGIRAWLELNFESKKTGNPFTISDVQSYIRRSQLPGYLGKPLGVEYLIEKHENEFSKPKYNIYKVKSNG